MNTIKQILTITLLSACIISPITCDNTVPTSPVPTEVICDKPHSGLLECACIMGLFLLSAYILQKIVPPLPPEKTDTNTESSLAAIVETPIETSAPIATVTTTESVEPVHFIAASINTLEDSEEQDQVRTVQEFETIEAIEAHVNKQLLYHFEN